MSQVSLLLRETFSNYKLWKTIADGIVQVLHVKNMIKPLFFDSQLLTTLIWYC